MKCSLEKQLTLVVVLVVAVAGALIGETSSAPDCLGTGATAEYEAYKAHVLDELANVTPTTEGYSYSTTFPPAAGYYADGDGQDFVYGSASCGLGLAVSECGYCLVGAKLALGRTCAFTMAGAVNLPQCTMSFVPVPE